MKQYAYIMTIILALFSAGAGFAEEEPAEDVFHHEAGVYIGYAPESYSTGWEYSYEHKFFDKLPVTFSIGNDAMFINKKGPVSLPAHLVVITTDIETMLPLFGLKGVYVGAGISPSFYSDNWSFEASSFRLPSRGFVAYQPDDKWTIVGGVAVFPRLKYPVWPIFGVIYKPVKELTFNLVSEDPSIVYSLNDKIALFAEGNYTYDEYEVDRDAAKNVILRYQDGYAGGGVEFKFSKFTKAALIAGGIFDRSLKYRDGGGKTDLRGGFYTELRMMSEF
jgi:hypothetical protein